MTQPAFAVLTPAELEALVRKAVREELAAANLVAKPAESEPELTKAEIATALRVSPGTVDRLVRNGMPHTYVNSVRRFDREACRAWLRERGKVGGRDTGSSEEGPAYTLTGRRH